MHHGKQLIGIKPQAVVGPGKFLAPNAMKPHNRTATCHAFQSRKPERVKVAQGKQNGRLSEHFGGGLFRETVNLTKGNRSIGRITRPKSLLNKLRLKGPFFGKEGDL